MGYTFNGVVFSGNISIVERPATPIIGTATATGTTTATVTFTQPVYNGGATIVSYTAVSTPGNITGTISQAGSGTITVTGLTALTNYTFAVYATNSEGNSASSSESNSVTTPDVVNQQAYISAGAYMTAAIKSQSDNSLYAWGLNSLGQLGDSTTTNKSSPVQVAASWKYISFQGQDAHGIKTDGTLWSWGYGAANGNGTTTNRSSPVQIGSATDWTYLSHMGDTYGLTAGAINSSNQLWVWGYTDYGTLAQGIAVIARSSPVQIAGSWREAAVGYDLTMAIDTTGRLYTCGSGFAGNLGTNSQINRSTLVQIGVGSSFTKVAARGGGGYGGMAISTDGTLWSWGANLYGSVGDGTTINRSSPVQIAGSWSVIAGASGLSSGIKTDGTLWTWGANDAGQLGIGNTLNRSSPVQIAGSWLSVSAGTNGFIAVNTSYQIFVCGKSILGGDITGRIGDGFAIDRSSPVQIGSVW